MYVHGDGFRRMKRAKGSSCCVIYDEGVSLLLVVLWPLAISSVNSPAKSGRWWRAAGWDRKKARGPSYSLSYIYYFLLRMLNE